MTPTNHHTSSQYLDACRTELTTDLRAAHTTPGFAHAIRGAVARTLVRAGVSMMPDEPPVVDGRVVVLARRTTRHDLPEAA